VEGGGGKRERCKGRRGIKKERGGKRGVGGKTLENGGDTRVGVAKNMHRGGSRMEKRGKERGTRDRRRIKILGGGVVVSKLGGGCSKVEEE